MRADERIEAVATIAVAAAMAFAMGFFAGRWSTWEAKTCIDGKLYERISVNTIKDTGLKCIRLPLEIEDAKAYK